LDKAEIVPEADKIGKNLLKRNEPRLWRGEGFTPHLAGQTAKTPGKKNAKRFYFASFLLGVFA